MPHLDRVLDVSEVALLPAVHLLAALGGQALMVQGAPGVVAEGRVVHAGVKRRLQQGWKHGAMSRSSARLKGKQVMVCGEHLNGQGIVIGDLESDPLLLRWL